MKTTDRLLKSKFIFASPWLLTAAATLLVIIVVTFAFHNLRLEKRLMTNAMLQKAETLMRALKSGARASYLADLRRNYWESNSWRDHAQRVIEHLIEDEDIKEIGLIDANGIFIAHSNRAKINEKQTSRSSLFEKDSNYREKTKLYYQIVFLKDYGKVFETIKGFKPHVPFRPHEAMKHMGDGQDLFFMERKGTKGHRRANIKNSITLNQTHFIIIGLDMKAYDATLDHLRVQILILSLVMLLIGFAGWFSLSVIQGYRVSQKTLIEIQAFTSLLVASLPVSIIATDHFGNIVIWNEAVAKLTGIKKSQAVGENLSHLLPDSLFKLFKNSSDQKEKKAEPIEILETFNNNEYVLLCQVVIVTDDGHNNIGKMLLLSDVTEMKQLEQKIRESEKLAAIGKVAGGVAHEVRNPLSSIKGLALLLRNKFAVGSNEQNTADLLIQETERMNRTISEMMSLTRTSSISLAPVDTAALLNEELMLFQAEISAHGIIVVLDIDNDLKPICGDKDRLVQVIINILLNSIQAMEEGGTLSLTGKQHDSENVKITISDTGVGISNEILNQVFDPYFTTKKEGSGIGLAISQKIITDHGGIIKLDSQLGNGTTVTLVLPAA